MSELIKNYLVSFGFSEIFLAPTKKGHSIDRLCKYRPDFT